MFPQPEHPTLLRHSNHVQAPPHNLRALLHLSFVVAFQPGKTLRPVSAA